MKLPFRGAERLLGAIHASFYQGRDSWQPTGENGRWLALISNGCTRVGSSEQIPLGKNAAITVTVETTEGRQSSRRNTRDTTVLSSRNNKCHHCCFCFFGSCPWVYKRRFFTLKQMLLDTISRSLHFKPVLILVPRERHKLLPFNQKCLYGFNI